MAKTEEEMINECIDAIANLGAQSVSCDWVDRRGGYVVTVDFGDNRICEAIDTNKLKAYSDAHQVAIMKKASM